MLNVASLLYNNGGDDGCPVYSFFGIPWDDWACEDPFTVDGLGIDVLVLASCDEKLGIIDLSYTHVIFKKKSSTPNILFKLILL